MQLPVYAVTRWLEYGNAELRLLLVVRTSSPFARTFVATVAVDFTCVVDPSRDSQPHFNVAHTTP
jgi:type IV secretory pathway TrbF-like protein